MLIFLLLLTNFICVNGHEKIEFIEFKVGSMHIQLISSLFIIILSGVKIIHALAHTVTQYLPESNLLLIFGVIIGTISSQLHIDAISSYIDENTFFYILLPPIILEASLSIYHKTFAVNLVGVLVFAIIATLANFFLIGYSLEYLTNNNSLYLNNTLLKFGNMTGGTVWVFASLIVAVDPVAVLGIFQEIHVDNNLYYLVFGESLFNDGVSVVLYEVMKKLSSHETIKVHNLIRAVILFFCVCIGGAIIGLILSIISCLITRFTFKTPLSEPIIVIMLGYLSYIFADILGWSGIISMISYGVIQAAYGFQNITQKSLIVTKRLIKIFANLTEAIIFLYIGIEVPKRAIMFFDNIEFILWSVFLCLYFRYVVTNILALILNYFQLNVRIIQWNELFIIAYGGLRGGIAYCLAKLTNNDLILDATLFIVIYTIIFMGFTMKPLVQFLNIKIDKPEELSLFIKINDSVIGHLLAAVEEIIGMKGHNASLELFKQIEEKYIRPVLQRDPISSDEKIMKTYEKMNMAMHMATTAPPGSTHYEYYSKKLKPQLRSHMYDPLRTYDNLTPLPTTSHLDLYGRAHVIPPNQSFQSLQSSFFQQSRTVNVDGPNLASRISHMLMLKKRNLQMTFRHAIKTPRKLNRLASDISSIDISVPYQLALGNRDLPHDKHLQMRHWVSSRETQ